MDTTGHMVTKGAYDDRTVLRVFVGTGSDQGAHEWARDYNATHPLRPWSTDDDLAVVRSVDVTVMEAS